MKNFLCEYVTYSNSAIADDVEYVLIPEEQVRECAKIKGWLGYKIGTVSSYMRSRDRRCRIIPITCHSPALWGMRVTDQGTATSAVGMAAAMNAREIMKFLKCPSHWEPGAKALVEAAISNGTDYIAQAAKTLNCDWDAEIGDALICHASESVLSVLCEIIKCGEIINNKLSSARCIIQINVSSSEALRVWKQVQSQIENGKPRTNVLGIVGFLNRKSKSFNDFLIDIAKRHNVIKQDELTPNIIPVVASQSSRVLDI